MKAQDLKNSILQMAMGGKLVPQDPDDEPASVLLERIREEKEQLIKEKKIKRNNKESVIFRKNNHFYEKVGKKGEEVCIDDEIPFDIPDSWEWCRMENIIQLISGRDMKSNEYNDIQKGIPYITGASNIENMNLIINRWIENPGVKAIKNDILLTCKGTIGKLHILNEQEVHIARQIMAIRILNETLIFREFILLILEYYVNKLQNLAKSMIPGISREDVLKILVPIPPINEQKGIVKKIEELLPLIKEYNLLDEKLEKLNTEFPKKIKDSILQEAIQGKLVPQDSDDEPATVLLEKIRAEKERLIKEKKIKRNKKESFIYKKNNHFYEKIGKRGEEVCIDDEIPFDIPENWEWTRIKNISEFVTKGTTPKGGKSAYINKGIKFLRVENIGKNGNLNLDNIKYVDEEIHENFLKRSILKENDLLISIAGALGRTAIIPKNILPLNTNQAVSFVRWFNTDLIFIPFIEKVINSPEIQKLLLKQSKVTAIPNLTLEIIRECLIPLPPLKEQERIVKKIEEFIPFLD